MSERGAGLVVNRNGTDRKPNILFLMVDCMRADVLTDRERFPQIPNFQALQTRGSTFSQTISGALEKSRMTGFDASIRSCFASFRNQPTWA